ncbi:uncharacterized protein LOC105835506 [Monomorium pharaonis]|uniref:uncharacterized protein LOC105835506 n=1 Tax=Monomorium pharaonis TaxID=307658 RepID=UPI0017467804|nr:uncharacterized protein LOC105835506 [Monomorium pharaonis]
MQHIHTVLENKIHITDLSLCKSVTSFGSCHHLAKPIEIYVIICHYVTQYSHPVIHIRNRSAKMIAATYNCGCPAKPSFLIPDSVRLQALCSSCCFQPHNNALRDLPVSAAVISASKESMSKQFPRSRSEKKLKNLEMSNKEQAPTKKVVSEIVRKERPYKEIEAIINDNRVIIRMQKEPIKEEYDPPCECIGQVTSKESALSQRKCNDGFVFNMAHGNLELGRTLREDTQSTEKTCEEAGCRMVTLYPNIKDDARNTTCIEVKKSKTVIDLEENPNIFLLRIRKHSDCGDKRQTIDLEFRAPRPWKKDLLKPEIVEEHMDADKEYKEEIDKQHEDEYNEYIDGEYDDETDEEMLTRKIN